MSNDWEQGPPHDQHDGYIHRPETQSPGYQQPTDSPSEPWGPPAGGHQPPVHQPGNSPPAGKPKLETNDVIAMILSLFFPGIGHLMVGQTTKGIVLFLVAIFTCGLGGLLSIAMILDVYCVAMARKRRPVDDWEFFPDINSAF